MEDKFYKQLDRAIAVASEHEKELLGYPGVVSVGAGPKRTAGKITGEAAIIVTVRKKHEVEELERQGQKLLPPQLAGVPVDVLEQGKPVEAPEIRAALENARVVLRENREKWLKTPNVTGIGIGYKTVKGHMNFNQVAIKVFVAKKLPLEEVRQLKLTEITAEIDGVVTDVEALRLMRPTSSASGSRDDRKDPLVGGITVGVNTKPFWYGTLGSIVFDASTGERMVLSNQHVLDGPAGTEVVQPSPIGLDDSLEIGFQLDFCNPLHFFRLDTPNTTVGTVLAGAAVAAAVAAALSDEIDPTRRGQDATVPPAAAKTMFESHKVNLEYVELPIPGTHFKIKTNWEYMRHTDAGDFSHRVREARKNPHALVDKLLLTDKKLYHPGDTVRLFGLILPEECAPKESKDPGKPISAEEIKVFNRVQPTAPLSVAVGERPASPKSRISAKAAVFHGCRCERYHATAILTPRKEDRAFPIVLREPSSRTKAELLSSLIQIASHLDDKELLARVFRMIRYGCVYVGEFTAGEVPLGPWNHYLFVQTVNFTTEGMKPTEAAQTIGGLPVSQNSKPQVDLACGPFVWEDGQFDIELI